MVALVGFMELSRLLARIRVGAVVAGKLRAGYTFLALAAFLTLEAADFLLIFLGLAIGLGILGALIFLIASIFLPSSMVLSMVLVLTIFFSLCWFLRKSSASARHL